MCPEIVHATFKAYEAARKAGASPDELRERYKALESILAAHFADARGSSGWQAPQAVKVRTAARPAPAA